MSRHNSLKKRRDMKSDGYVMLSWVLILKICVRLRCTLKPKKNILKTLKNLKT